jgi:predicted nucleic acid-binding protein
MLFDTSFFIHLSGRGGTRSRDAALAFLESHPDAPLYTSRICWAEMAEGVASPMAVNELLADYSIIEIDEDVAWHTSRVARALKTSGSHIGDNDCWIAGTALSKGLALVTRNVKHFSRLPALQCVLY